jgi:hypothetical protein
LGTLIDHHGYHHVSDRQCHYLGNGGGDWLDAAFDWLRTDLHYDANTIAIVKYEVEAVEAWGSFRPDPVCTAIMIFSIFVY